MAEGGHVMIIQSDPGWNTSMLPQFKQFQVDLIRFGPQRWGLSQNLAGRWNFSQPDPTAAAPGSAAGNSGGVLLFPVPLFFPALAWTHQCWGLTSGKSLSVEQPWSPGSVVGRRNEGWFPKEVKGPQSILSSVFPQDQHWQFLCLLLQCLSWMKKGILAAEHLLE